VVAGVIAHDDAAMEQLYALFQRSVRYYLCRALGPQDLEDRIHDVFIAVVRAIRAGKLYDANCLVGFVRTCVGRKIAQTIDVLVTARRTDVVLPERDLAELVVDACDNPEELAVNRQRQAFVRQALEALRPLDREIVERFYVAEQSAAHIMAAMDLSDTQFRLLKSRAMEKLSERGTAKAEGRRVRSTREVAVAKRRVRAEAIAA
jgi:RNA polymerase sigma factor (sigma-70 family)